MNYPGLVDIARKRDGKSIWEIDGIAEALPALEAQRKRDLEEWMDANGFDLVVFPANGSIGKADLDTNQDSADHALQNGVKYSNGNRAIRHMGVPTVSVTMGLMSESQMPVNLTFAGKHGEDSILLRYAYAYEQRSMQRTPPPVTPPLLSDTINLEKQSVRKTSDLEFLDVAAEKLSASRLRISGKLKPATSAYRTIEVYVKQPDSGLETPAMKLSGVKDEWTLETDYEPFEPPKPTIGGYGQGVGKPMVIVRATDETSIIGKLLIVN